MNFQIFNLHPSIEAGIRAAGFTIPTPIQSQAIPPVLQGRDVMGLAQTGTGKTAAFALPIMHRLMTGKGGCVKALIVAPTRELAEQIHESFDALGRHTGLRSLAVYGGVGINPQIKNLRKAPEIVVACPGRLLDHITRGTVDLSRVETLVLDEADQMFDMGFLPDIRRILKHLPRQRQTLVFSATMPEQIRRLAREVLHDPVTVQVNTIAPADTVSHALYPVAAHLKTPLLLKLLHNSQVGSVLVFTRTKHRAKRLGNQLAKAGYTAASLQGNLSQNRRQAALDGFRDGTFQILVATDIAARGIDVSRVSHVINFDIPATVDAYIHRIGRTGRADRSGEAFTLITEEDRDKVRAIDRVLGGQVERRTLADFNYSSPAPRQNNGGSRGTRRPGTSGRPGGNAKGSMRSRKPNPRMGTGIPAGVRRTGGSHSRGPRAGA